MISDEERIRLAYNLRSTTYLVKTVTKYTNEKHRLLITQKETAEENSIRFNGLQLTPEQLNTLLETIGFTATSSSIRVYHGHTYCFNFDEYDSIIDVKELTYSKTEKLFNNGLTLTV